MIGTFDVIYYINRCIIELYTYYNDGKLNRLLLVSLICKIIIDNSIPNYMHEIKKLNLNTAPVN